MSNIGHDIKSRRTELGLTQSELAGLAEVSINTIVAIERGTGNPSLSTLEKICKVMGIEIRCI